MSGVARAQPHFLVTEENAFGLDVSLPSSPRIVGASNCQGIDVWTVSIRGGHPTNGEYDLFFGSPINGVPFSIVATAPVGATSPTVISVDLTGRITSGHPPSYYYIMARERRQVPAAFPPGSMITVTSDESNYLPLRDPGSLPTPFIAPAPLFTCGAATGIGGHQPGDSVRLIDANGQTRFQLARAFGTFDFIGEVVPKFSTGEKLHAQYSTCSGNETSPPSVTESVIPYLTSRLPKPHMTRIASVAGVASLPVLGAENGARLSVQFVRAGEPVVNETRVCVGQEPCVVHVPAAWKTFEVRDEINVSQALCADSNSDVLRWSISSCYDQSPRLSRVPANGDRSLSFSDYALNSWLIASLCLRWDAQLGACATWQQIGSAYASEAIELTQPLTSGDRVAVSQQTSDGCPPIHAAGYIVR